MPYIEQTGPGGVRDLHCRDAGEQKANVIFGQEHEPRLRVYLRLVIAYPQQLWRGEAGQRRITDILDKLARADLLGDPAALCVAALVGPDDTGTQNAILAIQQHNTVHLAGEAHPAHIRSVHAEASRRHQARANGRRGRLPPVVGILLRPAGLRMKERIIDEGISQDTPIVSREESSLDARRAEIDAEQCLHHIRSLMPVTRYDPVSIGFVQSQHFIDDAIALDSIRARQSFFQRRAVNLVRQVPDEIPLDDGAPHRRYLVLGIRIQVKADALAIGAITHILQDHRQFERLHEERGASHVIIIECTPAGVAMLMTKFPLGMEQRGVFGQVLAVHNEVLPVHVDLQARGVHAQAAHAVNNVEAGGDVAHQNVHRRLAVLVLQEDGHALRGRVRHDFAHPFDELVPGVNIVALEVIVVALGAGPDDEMRAQRGGKVHAALERVDALAAQRFVRIDEGPQFIGRIGMQAGGNTINIHRPQRGLDTIYDILIDLARIMILQAINQVGQPIDDAAGLRYHVFVRDFGVIARRYKARNVGAKGPDAQAVLNASVIHGSSFSDSSLIQLAITLPDPLSPDHLALYVKIPAYGK